MLTLAFDTSTSFGSVVLFDDHVILYEQSWLRQKSHSEMLTAAIDQALTSSSKKPQDMKALYVGVGPGSFTGIRVTVNVARSLAFSLGLEVNCLDSFDLLASGVDPSRTSEKFLLGMVDAFNNELFIARFENVGGHWKRISKSQSMTLDQVANEIKTSHLCVGEAFDHYADYFAPELKKRLVRDASVEQFPNVKNLVPRSQFAELTIQPLAWNHVQALYLKASAAEEKLK